MASGRTTSRTIYTQKEAVVKAMNAVIAEGKTAPGPTTLATIIQHPNTRAFDDFCSELHSTLLACFSCVGKVRDQLARERAIAKFHSSISPLVT